MDAYLVRDGEPDEYLGTQEVRSGDPSRSVWDVPLRSAKPGKNVVRLQVSPDADGIHRLGWRGFLDRWFPDLLNETAGPWAGAIQVDAVLADRNWTERWAAYRDLIQVYAGRGMWAEAAAIFEQALVHGVHPDVAQDLDLLQEIAQETGLAGFRNGWPRSRTGWCQTRWASISAARCAWLGTTSNTRDARSKGGSTSAPWSRWTSTGRCGCTAWSKTRVC